MRVCQFKGRGEGNVAWPVCQNSLGIRNEVVRLRVAESCLFVMCGNILLILTSLNHDLVPVCVIVFPE